MSSISISGAALKPQRIITKTPLILLIAALTGILLTIATIHYIPSDGIDLGSYLIGP